ncbi:hypothetical protein B0J11DRAFT_542900 [Dendryphion nanum]|uniref:Uncharacterized protein n=1 Tax=Dendryphion nanum TaxID=256645 RepID=A0A9P9D3G5_9PLEO|nr:hypothetical protein B0J11DRAFT_542900 [Dendryphion nanum]
MNGSRIGNHFRTLTHNSNHKQMERLDIGHVYHGFTDGEDRVFEYSVRFRNLFSGIQIRLWDLNDEAAAELIRLDSQTGPYDDVWDKLLIAPNRDRLSVNPKGFDIHGTTILRVLRVGLNNHTDEPNTIIIELKPDQDHKVVTLIVEFRLRSDGHKIMIETCGTGNNDNNGFEDNTPDNTLRKKMKEIEEREEKMRDREASVRLAYMKLLDVTKGMEHILKSMND